MATCVLCVCMRAYARIYESECVCVRACARVHTSDCRQAAGRKKQPRPVHTTNQASPAAHSLGLTAERAADREHPQRTRAHTRTQLCQRRGRFAARTLCAPTTRPARRPLRLDAPNAGAMRACVCARVHVRHVRATYLARASCGAREVIARVEGKDAAVVTRGLRDGHRGRHQLVHHVIVVGACLRMPQGAARDIRGGTEESEKEGLATMC